MELLDMNLTEIISTANAVAKSPDNTKVTMTVLVLLYLLGRDTIKYLVPLLKEHLAQHKPKEQKEAKLE